MESSYRLKPNVPTFLSLNAIEQVDQLRLGKVMLSEGVGRNHGRRLRLGGGFFEFAHNGDDIMGMSNVRDTLSREFFGSILENGENAGRNVLEDTPERDYVYKI